MTTTYEVLERVATGGFCEILRAKQQNEAGFEKVVALKRLLPEHAQRPDRVQALIDEAKLAASLTHGNIAQVIDLVQLSGEWSVVLEFVAGLDLFRLTRIFAEHDRRLDVPECLHIVREILVALDYLHNATDADGESLGLVHGDMAPGNVMVSVTGEVKLIDFGMLRTQNVAPSVSPVGGKVRYSAPEQVRGGARDVRGDLYATGLILWELLAGVRVFEGMNLEELVTAVGRGATPPVEIWRPELPPVISAIVLRALASEPDRRFNSAADFLRAMGRAEVPWDPVSSAQVLSGLIRRLRAAAVQSPVKMAGGTSLEDVLDQQLR